MARRRTAKNPHVTLDVGEVRTLSVPDIRAILRAAESIIGSGGRTTLVKILRGSKSQKTLCFATNPAYGSLAADSQGLVENKVDWCIESGYLRIERTDGFPLLAYTEKGLNIECMTIARESLVSLKSNPESFLSDIDQMPHKTLFLIFDLIAEQGPKEYRKLLQLWESVGTKRMRSRIRRILAEWDGSELPVNHSFDVCYIDESLSELEWDALEYARKRLRLHINQVRYVGSEFPSLADVDIYLRLKGIPQSCFVTNDRPFHNALLENKFPSFFFDREDFTLSCDPLAGIKPRGIFKQMPNDSSIQRHSPEVGIEKPFHLPAFLNAGSASQQKRARTKRRRIKNYFGGLSRMEEVRISLSVIPFRGHMIVGFKTQITSNSDLKALDATESYLIADTAQNPTAAFSIAMVQLLQLRIYHIRFTFYYDKSSINTTPDHLEGDDLGFWEYLKTLADSEIQFVGVERSALRISRLKKKLSDLSSGKSNELISFDYSQNIKSYLDLDAGSV